MPKRNRNKGLTPQAGFGSVEIWLRGADCERVQPHNPAPPGQALRIEPKLNLDYKPTQPREILNMKMLNTSLIWAALPLSVLAANVTGTWKSEFDSQIGRQKYPYTFQQNGTKFAQLTFQPAAN
jgi:hypothetical protein